MSCCKCLCLKYIVATLFVLRLQMCVVACLRFHMFTNDPHPGKVIESCCDQDVPSYIHTRCIIWIMCEFALFPKSIVRASVYMCECVHAHVFAYVSARVCVCFHAHVYAVDHMQCILHA